MDQVTLDYLWFFYRKHCGIFGPPSANISEKGSVLHMKTLRFLKKIMYLDGFPDCAILCTVDVVGLYPSIPHEEGSEASREVLDLPKSLPCQNTK